MANFQSYLQNIKASIQETSVEEVFARTKDPGTPVLIDVREGEEYQDGYIPKAVWIPRGKLEMRIEDTVPDRKTEVILYCAGGNRSAMAARTLLDLGYEKVLSMAGGYGAWKRVGYPTTKPFVFTQDQKTRYSRHTMLPEVGEAGQAKLLQSKVLLIGAGGLGSPAAYYLAAAGVGTLGLVDDDVVDASNLQRQILHNTTRIGVPKVDSAEKTLRELNPDVQVRKHALRLRSENVLEVIADYDLIVDGADNFQTRYLLNDASLIKRKPVVHASVFRFEGQLTSFVPYKGPCYRCLYPEPPPAGMAPSCNEAGVLGVLPGTVGLLQATEAIKMLLGIGETLAGRLLIYDALGSKIREMRLRRDPECVVCADPQKPIELIDYDAFCSVR